MVRCVFLYTPATLYIGQCGSTGPGSGLGPSPRFALFGHPLPSCAYHYTHITVGLCLLMHLRRSVASISLSVRLLVWVVVGVL
jgi:hypothetical protein